MQGTYPENDAWLEETLKQVEQDTGKRFTAKQRIFVREYLIDLNVTQAAIRAGYSQRTAAEAGSSNLKKPHLRAAIDAALLERAKRAPPEVSTQRVLEEIGRLAYSNMLDYIQPQADGYAVLDLSQLTRQQAAAIQEVTIDEYMDGRGEDARPVKRVKFKLSDKSRSLELLGKHLGLFREQLEITHKTARYSLSDEELMRIATGEAADAGTGRATRH